MKRTLTLTITLIWFVLVVIMGLVWLFKIRVGLQGLAVPYLVLVLSFFVFNTTPRLFRRIHHGFVVTSLLVSLALVYKFTFHGGEQGGVGAYLTILGVGALYLIFITLFLAALGSRRLLEKS